ncbi:hypothetical protein BZB76_4447 [Actinomadura pelletieri DSM 43383]|uniref:DoxX-like protein n=1 Tax=Actinomadura pelletieri DSM 43383 TaxID=1120940 RepID=A0A495QHL6_9ACTN|nr:hypothetical protein [Actinomadura pelletieri]RKS71642.1 hypothetical protein BZB76_4447 [Actinomadura pelletieri DSM 43383]
MSQISRTEWAGRWDTMVQAPTLTKLYWLLRVGVAVEYIGHGWAGLSRSRAWLPYYDLFGISADFALDYMFYITGTIDITVGLLVLFWPARILLLHATVWGVFTALLRPTVGEGWWEFLERGGNYGMPAAMLILVGLGGWSVRGWLQRADAPTAVTDRTLDAAHWAARGGLALLLIGHGGFGAFENKPYWYDFFDFFGITRSTVDSANLMVVFGTFEIILGLAVLFAPGRALLLFVLGWKLFTELLRPLVGQEWFQFVERDGDYVLPVALILMSVLYAESLRRRAPAAPPDPEPRSTSIR